MEKTNYGALALKVSQTNGSSGPMLGHNVYCLLTNTGRESFWDWNLFRENLFRACRPGLHN